MIEIYGSCNLRGYKKALKNFLNFVLKKEKNSKFKKIFIIFTNDNKIRKLNKKFLNKDEKTDVLSFEINDIGEIYVNVDFAKRLGNFSYYIAFYSLHGLLHLMGYEHKIKSKEKEMFYKQEEYMKLWKF
ncbi:MAG: rRNA maturation RNase YbeY [Candidatus Hydrothermia bacterium]|jgi:probable rRNA maturation factor|nr:rRNA maturation RNase YbeY [Candidatus Hydrothermia bacterium]